MLSNEEKAEVRAAGKEIAAAGMLIVEGAKGIFDSILEDSEIFTKYAKLVKKGVDALMTEGFTSTEAINIVTSALNKLGGNGK